MNKRNIISCVAVVIAVIGFKVFSNEVTNESFEVVQASSSGSTCNTSNSGDQTPGE